MESLKLNLVNSLFVLLRNPSQKEISNYKKEFWLEHNHVQLPLVFILIKIIIIYLKMYLHIILYLC